MIIPMPHSLGSYAQYYTGMHMGPINLGIYMLSLWTLAIIFFFSYFPKNVDQQMFHRYASQ